MSRVRCGWVLGLGLLAAACADGPEDDGAPAPTPVEQLDACGLPVPCTVWTSFDGCTNLGDRGYREFDVCTFEALTDEGPSVVRAARFEFCGGGDLQLVVDLHLYRWADGSMTCVIQHDAETFEVRACTLPDPSAAQACLAAAVADEEPTETCLDFDSWGLVLGDAIEPACGPI